MAPELEARLQQELVRDRNYVRQTTDKQNHQLVDGKKFPHYCLSSDKAEGNTFTTQSHVERHFHSYLFLAVDAK